MVAHLRSSPTQWGSELEAAKHEALLAVDLLDRPVATRSVRGFLLHIHQAWLHLLRARALRAGERAAETWDLAEAVARRFSEDDPVRRNLDLTMALEPAIDHRDEPAVALAVSGYVQATLVNFEDELTSTFGVEHSLGEVLRFPVYVATFTPDGVDRLARTRDALPPELAARIAAAAPDGDADPRVELRLQLLPKLGPREDAGGPVTFVSEASLSDDQRAALAGLGERGVVVVRERHLPVSNVDKLKASEATRRIAARLPYRFNLHFHFVRAWRKLNVRPPGGARHPERTDERYCVYDAAHDDYLYTDEFVNLVVDEIGTEDAFRAFFGRDPVPK